jgi:hypothetical protein
MKRLGVVVCALLSLTLAAQPFMPADHRALTKSVSYPEMKSFLESVDGKGPVRVTVEGTTTQGRNVYLVRLSRTERAAWNILFYAQQHGDEISGKDAALYLIREMAAHPERLPTDTAVWILPMMNPDGAEAGTRANAAGADLNRDHLTLLQPETQALYRVVRRVLPDIAVDCHEFGRSGSGWRKRGWEKWPDITMDGLNNPMFDAPRRAAADRWVNAAADAAKAAGHPFLRYWVGGVPPDEEQRHSAPDLDSGLNGIGAYGGLSFIIEAAARDGDEVIAKELGNRVDAYLALLRRFVAGNERRKEDAGAIARARVRPLPPFIPVNYLWVNPEGTVTKFPVTRVADGKTIEVATANKMTAIAVKKSVTTPASYAIEARAASEFGAMLERQAIPFERLATARSISAEPCTLLRVEEEFDEVYARYGGRQIVRCSEAATRELAAGSLIVPIEGAHAMRTALLLEPQMIYGIYAYPLFRALAGEGGALPVLRVMP